jgi:hypothetical protein
MSKSKEGKVIRLLLRSIYLKGQVDANRKTSDLSWEEKIISKLQQWILGHRKQVRYETNERRMGLDGQIITTSTQVRYDPTEEAYNRCLEDLSKELER